MSELAGKIALVTGAANGIGQAAALLFAARGAHVAAADLDESALTETIAGIERAGVKALAIACDVSDPDAVAAMVERTVRHFGGLDYAFNNAGITHPGDPEWSYDALDKTIDINLKGVMYCLREELRHMAAHGGGAIVNTSSVGGLIASGTPSMPAYTASKHAVIGLTKAAALRHAREGIRVNAVLPGVTRTNMVRDVMAQGPEVMAALNDYAPMGRMADPAEIAEAVVWLCSDRASFVTGHSLPVDGGFLAQ